MSFWCLTVLTAFLAAEAAPPPEVRTEAARLASTDRRAGRPVGRLPELDAPRHTLDHPTCKAASTVFRLPLAGDHVHGTVHISVDGRMGTAGRDIASMEIVLEDDTRLPVTPAATDGVLTATLDGLPPGRHAALAWTVEGRRLCVGFEIVSTPGPEGPCPPEDPRCRVLRLAQGGHLAQALVASEEAGWSGFSDWVREAHGLTPHQRGFVREAEVLVAEMEEATGRQDIRRGHELRARARELMTRVVAEDHPDVLLIDDAEGVLLSWNGSSDLARPVHEATVAALERFHVPGSLDLLFARHNLLYSRPLPPTAEEAVQAFLPLAAELEDDHQWPAQAAPGRMWLALAVWRTMAGLCLRRDDSVGAAMSARTLLTMVEAATEVVPPYVRIEALTTAVDAFRTAHAFLQARHAAERALELAEASGQLVSTARFAMARVQYDLGRVDTAASLARSALEGRLSDRSRGMVLSFLSVIEDDLGHAERALALTDQAITQLAPLGGNPQDVWRLQLNKARILGRADRHEDARATLEAVSQVVHDTGSPEEIANWLASAVSVAIGEDDLDEARDRWHDLRALVDVSAPSSMNRRDVHAFGAFLDLDEAQRVRWLDAWLADLERPLFLLAASSSEEALAAAIRNARTDVMRMLGADLPPEIQWERAQRWKGASQRVWAPSRTADDTTARRRDEAALRLAQIVHGGALPTSPNEATALLREIVDLDRELARKAAGTSRLVSNLDADEVRSALGSRGVLVDIYRWSATYHDGDSYTAFVLSGRPDRPGVTRVELGAASHLDLAVARWREAISSTDRSVPALDPLSELLVGPLEPLLDGHEQLVLSMDGALHDVAAAALKGRDGRYLIEHFALTHVVAPADLLDAPPVRPLDSRLAVTVGPPDAERLGAGTLLGRSASCARLDTLSALPFAQLESRQVARQLSHLPGVEQVDALDRPSVDDTRVALHQASFVHIATHGLAVPPACRQLQLETDPDAWRDLPLAADVGLVLGDPPAVWPAASMAALELAPGALVVLSACETGRGGAVQGEGIMGLPRAFLRAGAGEVVATLWRVDDRSTLEFMKDFYRRLRHRPEASVASVLREAQLAALRRPSRSTPRLWAPFVLHARGLTHGGAP